MPTQWGGPPPARSTPAPSTTPRRDLATDREPTEQRSSSGALSSTTEPMSDAEYEESPMASVQMDFREDREETSTASRAAMLADRKELGPDDVVDAGEDPQHKYVRYALKEKLMELVQNTTTDIDFSMRRMSDLVPGRITHFKVDPDDVILAALSGSQSLAQLHGAWTVLTKRMAAALRFAEKYDREFREKRLLLHNLKEGPDKLKYVITRFPRHAEDLTAGQKKSLVEDDKWEALNTPTWMHDLLNETEDLSPPDKSGEVNPSDAFSAPANELGLADERSDSETEILQQRIHQRQKGRVSFGSPGPLIIQANPAREEGLLGSGTPFKSQSGFLRGFGGERAPRFPSIRSASDQASETPNPLFGMATPGAPLTDATVMRSDTNHLPETPSQPPRAANWTSYQFSYTRNADSNAEKGAPP
ncbi:hypothetical protein CVT26_003765, partial [Gymnopilus dilepis]